MGVLESFIRLQDVENKAFLTSSAIAIIGTVYTIGKCIYNRYFHPLRVSRPLRRLRHPVLPDLGSNIGNSPPRGGSGAASALRTRREEGPEHAAVQ